MVIGMRLNRLTFMSVAVLLTLVVAACGGDDDTDSTESGAGSDPTSEDTDQVGGPQDVDTDLTCTWTAADAPSDLNPGEVTITGTNNGTETFGTTTIQFDLVDDGGNVVIAADPGDGTINSALSTSISVWRAGESLNWSKAPVGMELALFSDVSGCEIQSAVGRETDQSGELDASAATCELTGDESIVDVSAVEGVDGASVYVTSAIMSNGARVSEDYATVEAGQTNGAGFPDVEGLSDVSCEVVSVRQL